MLTTTNNQEWLPQSLSLYAKRKISCFKSNFQKKKKETMTSFTLQQEVKF